ncbi:MSC_0623 family F1-like ATPase-associated protein [[Mycoplasma] gypis]|uniref:DUF2714 domain-containing protein n=1 Tax=[Mycoplasma] gypis TaxID=92404 RepID=A0ABZ2RQA5_9BACT|nr:DUF2714 domain-containing protein [[Mycoplasma] gypis]MBN0919017.1 DUF2714 domain-containing protein [[Mycoplasma] gypis]
MKFSLKKKSANLEKNNLVNEYQKIAFAEFNKLKNSEKKVSFQEIKNQIIIELNSPKIQELMDNLEQDINKAISEKKQILFENFYLDWNRNERFSLNMLIPIINPKINSNSFALNLIQSDNIEKMEVLETLNSLIDNTFKTGKLFAYNKDLIFAFDKQTKSVKVFFSENFIK